MTETFEKTPANVKLLTTPNANYRIVLSGHIKSNTLEEMGKNQDGIIYEVGVNLKTQNEIFLYFNVLERDVQYGKVTQEFLGKKNLYGVDVFGINKILDAESFSSLNIDGLGMIMFVTGLILRANESDNLSRRRFLKGSGLVLTGVGGLLFGPTAITTLARLFPIEHTATFLGHLHTLKHTMRGDEFILHFRNLVMANKLEKIAEYEAKLKNKKPNLTFLVGAAHIEILKILKIPRQEREKFINDLVLKASTLKTDTGENLLSEEEIGELTKSLTEIPSLQIENGKPVGKLLNLK